MNKKYIWGPQDKYLNCIYLLLRARQLLTNNSFLLMAKRRYGGNFLARSEVDYWALT